ncbi:YdcF family protein [Limosilactobacillus kribbianus]|uniref:YdcF family protein n=1 Tax=Limosilactobacillus kribbianus TaxID=2982695 RepID=UPI002264A906|nr:YdcF family protein [Limosilactobacillus kribbianus]
MRTVEAINTLAAFCGPRDIAHLDQVSLQATAGIKQVDVAVLFGGSIIAGGDEFATAIKNKLAKHYVIVGGHGHTTPTLRRLVHQRYPQLATATMTEAEIFQQYIKLTDGETVRLLEKRSTNCGNNITYLLDLLAEHQIDFDSILLMQDASMMRRMAAGLRKECPEKTIIQYATYQATVVEENGRLAIAEEIPGMWSLEHYISLLLGEIPRLTDDVNGYGPRGKGYIAHVDVPAKVRQAFRTLSGEFPQLVRKANPAFSSENN